MHFLNPTAKVADEECLRTLQELRSWVRGLPTVDMRIRHITRYAAIVCTGTLERAFKHIIADYVARNCPAYIDTFVTNTIRTSSRNPSYEEILKVLALFDDNWKDVFKQRVAKLPYSKRDLDSLKSLVSVRNHVAHGGSISVGFIDVMDYYCRARSIVLQLETFLK